MTHRIRTGICWLMACVAFTVLNVQVGFAATSLAPYAGELKGEVPAPAEPLTLWYREPATVWTSALPLGNGMQGAMVFGGIDSEVICLNESSFWTGSPYSPENPNALEALPQAQQLLFEGQYRQAENLIAQRMLARPTTEASYQPIGDLLLTFPKVAVAENYHRELNLRTATTVSQFTSDGVTYTREMFANAPDNVLVMRLTADKPGKISFKLSMQTGQPVTGSDGVNDTLIVNGTNRGFGAGGVNIPKGLKFQIRAKIIHSGGKLTKGSRDVSQPPQNSQQTARGNRRGRGSRGPSNTQIPVEYSLEDADSAIILIASATSYKKYDDVTGDPDVLASAIIDKATSKGYDTLRKEQLADYQVIFNRVSLDMGANEDAELPTDERIRNFPKSNDPALVTLYFQYGRFLLISCSRNGQPANLQGIWNSDVNPSWGGKYTININTEMNYWPVGIANLGETIEPLMAMVEDMQVTGAKVASVMYGAHGWVAHHNTDLWRATGPIDYAFSGMWPCGGAWLCNTLYDYYEFSQDKAFLKRLYGPMKGSAEFFLDTLVEEPTHKWLVTNPSLSPENAHHSPRLTCVAGPTVDEQILRDLFAHYIEASEILGVDEDFRKQVAAARARLAPNQIGSGGQLQEWLEDWDFTTVPDQQHRHVSHLYGLYPGENISYYDDKKLIDAVRVSLEHRGDIATGWGLGWRLCLWARLHDGEHAYKIVRNLLADAQASGGSVIYTGGGSGVYNNLFDAHPPFQIDGNFGGAAGIAECLVQSTVPHAEKQAMIELLPALPPQWANGKVSGICARGGFKVAMEWKDGKLQSAAIINTSPATFKVLYDAKSAEVSIKAGQTLHLNEDLVVTN